MYSHRHQGIFSILILSFLGSMAGEVMAVEASQAIKLDGEVEFVATPSTTIAEGQFESNTYVRIFAERRAGQLNQDLSVNISQSGAYGSGAVVDPHALPAQVVDTYLLHGDSFDPGPITRLIGSLIFPEQILALIVTTATLKATDSAIGAPGLTYANTDRGIDFGTSNGRDTISLDLTTNTLAFDFRNNDGIDEVRIITVAAIPGDVNHDRIVNGQDIGMVASSWLTTGLNLLPDANYDGIVNGQDISIVASHWLNTTATPAGSGAAQDISVPEPSTLALIAIGAATLLSNVFRRARRAARSAM